MMSFLKSLLTIEEPKDYTKFRKKVEPVKYDVSSSDVYVSKPTYKTATDIAVYFNISSHQLNNIFIELGWAKKKDRWWLATSLGIEQGAKQEYNPKNRQKFIKWSSKIQDNQELIDATNELKFQPPFKAKTSYQEKIKKGKEYEEFVALYYEQQGYYVWEHGKEKGKLDNGIDLIVKKDNKILFIQCKNWSADSRYKITHEKLKSTRQDVSDYIEKNPIFKEYKQKIIYVISNDILHKSAYHYLEEYKDNIECQIIPF